MSSLNSISSGAATPVACKRPTAFEVNSKEFGPVAASAIAAAARATDVASSTVSLSTDGLKRFADDIGEAWDGAVHYVEGAVDGVENGIAHLGHEAVDAVTSAAHSVEHAYDEASSAVDGALTVVKDGLASAVGTVGGYLSMAASALTLR